MIEGRKSNGVPTYRFPFEPVERYLSYREGLPPHSEKCCGGGVSHGCLSAPVVANALRTSPRQVCRWRRNGLTRPMADRVATAMGLHPSALWADS